MTIARAWAWLASNLPPVHGFWTWFADIMGADFYSAHSICLSNDPVIMTLYVAANETIAFSYYIIGGVLMWTFAFERKVSINLSGSSALLFGAFIFSCGLTHLSMDILLFSGVYRLDVLVRMATASVSAVTAGKVVIDKWDAWAARRRR